MPNLTATQVEVAIATLLSVMLGAAIVLVAIRMEEGEMQPDTLRAGATYAIAVMILLGAFLLIYQGRGDDAQAWLAIGAVLGYVFRDAGAAATTSQAIRVADAEAVRSTTSSDATATRRTTSSDADAARELP